MTTSLRSDTTIDLILSSEDEPAVQCQSLPYYESDHIPILAEFTDLQIEDQQRMISKIDWMVYTTILTVLYTELDADQQETKMSPFE